MEQIIFGSLLISILHGLIPNHWLPIVSIARKEQWTQEQTTQVTFLSGLAHAASTVLIGLLLGVAGVQLHERWNYYFHLFAPITLILIGVYFVHQHYRHKHFHLQTPIPTNRPKSKIIAALAIAMFLSPCMEIEAFFLMAGSHGWWLILLLAVMYGIVSVVGMIIWVRLAYSGLLKLNWHKLEHNAGIITGIALVMTGILSFFIY
jgi:nickel/cobalt exporter